MTELHLPRRGRRRSHILAARPVWLAILGFATLGTALGQVPTPDRFTATTTQMSPSGLQLRIDVVEWSSDEARAAVVGALEADGDRAAALAELPSAGVVWRSGSGVGHSLKYAHRAVGSDGSERVTFVTEKPLDSYSFQRWSRADGIPVEELGYTVIELRLDAEGHGTGTLSLAAGVQIDTDAHTVMLDAAAPSLLADAEHEPKPYWARDN